MAYAFGAVGNGSGAIVVPVGGPPGLRGERGADSTVPGPEGREGPPGRDGEQGPAGAGAIVTRAARVNTPLWCAVVADGPTGCRPADPNNPAHRGQVIGVTAYGGMLNAQVTIHNVGDLMGLVATFAGGASLFVGTGGMLTPAPPTSGWRQIVATAVSSSQIVVALGEASIVDDAGDALLAEGGFSTPCDLDGAADPNAAGQYVTPAANARALSGKASLGHTSVFDQNYSGLSSDVQVGFRTLTAPRIYSLPDVDTYALGQDHVVADESGACSDALTITIQPGAGTGDIIGGPEGATTFVLTSPYQAVRFRRGAANLWIRV